MNTRQIASEYRMVKWAGIIQDRKSSGESIDSYCENRGLSRDSYFYYQKKLREATCENIEMISSRMTGSNLISSGFAEVKLNGATRQASDKEADGYSGSLTIKISGMLLKADMTYPVDQVAYLIRELTRQC